MHVLKLITLFGMSGVLSCTQTKTPSSSASSHPDSVMNNSSLQRDSLARDMGQEQIDYFIIRVPDNQFGYYIMIDGRMYIDQKTIPAVEGLSGFRTKEDAEKVAILVVDKIKKGQLPPDVTVDELKALGIIE